MRFKVKEEWLDRFPRYYILEEFEPDKWCIAVWTGQSKEMADFLCKLMNDHEAELDTYYEDC